MGELGGLAPEFEGAGGAGRGAARWLSLSAEAIDQHGINGCLQDVELIQ
jgi:hypothetical protein